MIGLELEESLGIFYNVPLHSRLQQVLDLLGSFQQISFFSVSGSVCVSTVPLGRISGSCRGRCCSLTPLPAHPTGNSQEFSLIQLQLEENREIRRWKRALVWSDERGKSPGLGVNAQSAALPLL